MTAQPVRPPQSLRMYRSDDVGLVTAGGALSQTTLTLTQPNPLLPFGGGGWAVGGATTLCKSHAPSRAARPRRRQNAHFCVALQVGRLPVVPVLPGLRPFPHGNLLAVPVQGISSITFMGPQPPVQFEPQPLNLHPEAAFPGPTAPLRFRHGPLRWYDFACQCSSCWCRMAEGKEIGPGLFCAPATPCLGNGGGGLRWGLRFPQPECEGGPEGLHRQQRRMRRLSPPGRGGPCQRSTQRASA